MDEENVPLYTVTPMVVPAKPMVLRVHKAFTHLSE